MSLSEKDLIESSLQEFKKRFQSSAPLRHFSEHQDEASVREAAERIGDGVFWVHFMRKVKASNINRKRRGDLVNEFSSKMESLIDEYVTKNRDCRTESESFLQKKMDGICEDFQTSLEAKFLMNPDMDLNLAEEILEGGKLSAMSYFERMWKHGNVGLFENYRIKLEEKLQDLKNELLEKQRRHLDNKTEEDARRSLNEVKEVALEMSRQIKNVLEGQEKPPMEITKEGVKGIRDYIIGKGKILNEKYGKLYSHLLGTLRDAIKSLDEAVENLSVDDATGWAEELDQKLILLVLEFEKESCDLHQNQQENAVVDSPSSDIDGEEYKSLKGSLKRIEDPVLTATAAFVPNDSIILEARHHFIDAEDCVDVKRQRIQKGSLPKRSQDVATVTSLPNVKQGHQHPQDVEIVAPRSPKRLKQMMAEEDLMQKVEPINIPDHFGHIPYLQALWSGTSVACFEKMLDEGEITVIVGNKNFENYAAHEVIDSLIEKRRSSTSALAILNLLKGKGFNIANDMALLYAIRARVLNADLLDWFFNNGADFNKIKDASTREPVLYLAIKHGLDAGLIQKIGELKKLTFL